MIEEATLLDSNSGETPAWALEISRFFNTPQGTSEVHANSKTLPRIAELLRDWQAPGSLIGAAEIEGFFAESSLSGERREPTSLTGSALESAIERNALRNGSRGYFFVGREPTDSGLPSDPEHIRALAPKGSAPQAHDLDVNSIRVATKRARYMWLGYQYRASRASARHERQRPTVPSEKIGQLLRNEVANQLIADVGALLADRNGMLAYRRKYLQPLPRNPYGWVEDFVQESAVPPRWIVAWLQDGRLASPGPTSRLDETALEFQTYLSARIQQLTSEPPSSVPIS